MADGSVNLYGEPKLVKALASWFVDTTLSTDQSVAAR
jgi:hypothetical protein